MLLGNDAAEGSDVTQRADADRVFLLLQGHMRRMREQLGVARQPERHIEHITVGPEFQAELAGIWQAYLPLQQALAADDFGAARQALAQLQTALAAIDDRSLTGHAEHIWNKERGNLLELFAGMQAAADIKALRTEFKPLSEEVGVLAKTFGFGHTVPVYELHCPMAFEGQGATWYQDNDQPQNPYYGSTMLKCADRVERLAQEVPAKTDDQGSHDHGAHENHSQH